MNLFLTSFTSFPHGTNPLLRRVHLTFATTIALPTLRRGSRAKFVLAVREVASGDPLEPNPPVAGLVMTVTIANMAHQFIFSYVKNNDL